MDGEPLQILADDGELGERTVIAAASSGEMVRYIIQSSSVTDDDLRAMRDSLADVPVTSFSDVKPTPREYGVDAPAPRDDLVWTPVSVIAATSDTVVISWAEDDFTAISDGVELKSQGRQIVVTDVKPDRSTSVQLQATEDVGGGVELQRERRLDVSAFSGSGIAPLTYQPYNTAYVHKTFIPDSRVSAVFCGNWPTYSFGGDNRSYRVPTVVDTPFGDPHYRTMLFGNVNWGNPSPYNFVWVKDVGASKIYNNDTLEATLYASTDEMNVTDISVGSTYAKAYFNHTASNPHCSFLDVNYGGAIRYAEWVEYYRSGTVAVDGYRFKAPAHEMYARFTNSSGTEVWQTVLRRPNDGFQCLLGNGACGMDFYQQSVSY